MYFSIWKSINSLISLYLCALLILQIYCATSEELLDYENQADWTGSCEDTKMQSPINIQNSTEFLTADYGEFTLIEMNYPPLKNVQRVIEHEHSFVFEFENKDIGAYLSVKKNGNTYKFNFINAHIHCPSEHHINGKEYSCEIHLVHQRSINSSDEDKTFTFLVVGIFLKKDETVTASNMFGSKDLDFSPYIKTNQNYYYYEGSLTTPPCTEAVNWLLSTKIVGINSEQLNDLYEWISKVYPIVGNDREVHDLQNREVYYVTPGSANANAWILKPFQIILCIFALFLFNF